MTKDTAQLKIEIPDGPPETQLQMLKDWVQIVRNMERVVGQEGSTDLSEAEKKIAELEKELSH
jgi:hypothetical protein